MKNKFIIKLSALLFLITIFFHCAASASFPKYHLLMLQSPLEPLTKLWAINIYDFLGPAMYITVKFLFVRPIYAFWFLCAFLGILLNKSWGKHALNHILITLCILSIFWPNISQRSTCTMETFMHRAYYAWVRNHYWLPLKSDLTDGGYDPSQKCQQYEPIYVSSRGSAPQSYQQAKDITEKKIAKNGGNIKIVPAYLSMFLISERAFKTSHEMYNIVFYYAKIVFYLFFTIIPMLLLLALNLNDIKNVFKRRTNHIKNNAFSSQSMLGMIINMLLAGSLIIALHILLKMIHPGLIAIMFLLLCQISYSYSLKAALKYPTFYWLFGLCFIAPGIAFTPLHLNESHHYLHITGKILFFSIIYVCSLIGGRKGKKIIASECPLE